jgi:hypothetical protein
MMVFELIELLRKEDPHSSVCHLGPYDLPESAAAINPVQTHLDAPGFVYLSTSLPPIVIPRSE